MPSPMSAPILVPGSIPSPGGEVLGCASWPSPRSAAACSGAYHPFRTTTLSPAQQILQNRHAGRLTLRGRRDVTGGWQETITCLGGIA
jgi:hypothetical protein